MELERSLDSKQKRLELVPSSKHMRTIGILTGISHQSGADYYIQINNQIQSLLPYKYAGYSSKCLLYSVNLEEYVEYLTKKRFDLVNNLLIDGISKLYNGGCDFIVIASNTGHMIINDIKKYHSYWLQKCPILHIGDCIAYKCKLNNINKIGLLGTKYTMQGTYMINQLNKHNINVIVPKNKDNTHNEIERIIEKELSFGKFNNNSRKYMLNIMKNEMIKQNCQGVILGCTEIGLLIQQKHIPNEFGNFKVMDSAQCHIDCAVKVQLGLMNVWDFEPNTQISCKL